MTAPPGRNPTPADKALWDQVEEAFDHRLDGVAAATQFERKLSLFVTLISDGTAATGRAECIGRLIKEEKRLQLARARRIAAEEAQLQKVRDVSGWDGA